MSAEEGPSIQLTLDDAVKFALDRNLDIKVQRLNPELQDIAMASARAFYSPTLSTAFSQSQPGRDAEQPAADLAAADEASPHEQLTYNASVTRTSSGEVELLAATLNNNRIESDSNNSLFNPQYNATWNFNYTQPLLRDFKIDAQRRTLQVTRINRDISDVQLRAAMTNMVSNVKNAYWDYVFATLAVQVGAAVARARRQAGDGQPDARRDRHDGADRRRPGAGRTGDAAPGARDRPRTRSAPPSSRSSG